VIGTTTKKPLQVSTNGTARPYIRLPASQVSEVQQLLDGHGIRYQVDEYFISFNGEPEEAVIDLGRGADAAAIQAILDSPR
jgi:hypothetical protein